MAKCYLSAYCRRAKECSGQPNSGCAADGGHDSSLPSRDLKFFDYFVRRYLGPWHLSRPVFSVWDDSSLLIEVFAHNDVSGRTPNPPGDWLENGDLFDELI
jgi:hypothetical protein